MFSPFSGLLFGDQQFNNEGLKVVPNIFGDEQSVCTFVITHIYSARIDSIYKA